MTGYTNTVDCFNEVRSSIMAIPDDRLASMDMSYEESMQEGYRGVELAEKYYDQLKLSDIDTRYLDDIAIRAGAFAYSVSAMDSLIKVGEENQNRYLALKRDGYRVRERLLQDFCYVFRKNHLLITTLEKIRTGRGDLEMMRDILALYRLGETYKDRIIKANVDYSRVIYANQVYKELSQLTSELDIEPEKVKEAKDICARVWSYLWEALEEIYCAGRFVFADQPQTERLFYPVFFKRVQQVPAI